jgi:mRNA-degrading endonuclease RelE of RelBE toxin-antitoxin system
MPNIILRPSFSKDLDGLRRSSRKHYQRASEILLEIQRDIEPTAPRRAQARIPKCYKYELPDGYRLVLQQGDSNATMVALVVGTHDHVESFLDGHKGYVFDKKTGHLRELRLATATETVVEMATKASMSRLRKLYARCPAGIGQQTDAYTSHSNGAGVPSAPGAGAL